MFCTCCHAGLGDPWIPLQPGAGPSTVFTIACWGGMLSCFPPSTCTLHYHHCTFCACSRMHPNMLLTLCLCVLSMFGPLQFGHQESGSESDIKSFCSDHYHVTFPMFSKIDVNGPNTSPVYQVCIAFAATLGMQTPALLGCSQLCLNSCSPAFVTHVFKKSVGSMTSQWAEGSCFEIGRLMCASRLWTMRSMCAVPEDQLASI